MWTHFTVKPSQCISPLTAPPHPFAPNFAGAFRFPSLLSSLFLTSSSSQTLSTGQRREKVPAHWAQTLQSSSSPSSSSSSFSSPSSLQETPCLRLIVPLWQSQELGDKEGEDRRAVIRGETIWQTRVCSNIVQLTVFFMKVLAHLSATGKKTHFFFFWWWGTSTVLVEMKCFHRRMQFPEVKMTKNTRRSIKYSQPERESQLSTEFDSKFASPLLQISLHRKLRVLLPSFPQNKFAHVKTMQCILGILVSAVWLLNKIIEFGSDTWC